MNVEIDVTNLKFKTERLILRPFRLTDLDDFFEYSKVEGVGEMAGWTHHKNKDESKEIIDMFLKEKKVLAITIDNKVIGSVGIEKYREQLFPEFDNQKGRELGFVLSKDFWGMGIMMEAVNRVLDYLFNDLKLDFVMCGYYDFNNRSKRLQEKLGFKYLKTEKTSPLEKIVYDTVFNIIYKEDYIKR